MQEVLFAAVDPEPLSPWQQQRADELAAREADHAEPPFQYHSETSVDAAHAIKPSAGTLRQQVYDYLAANGPTTDQAAAHALGMADNTFRPRRRELELSGSVVRFDAEGLTASGRHAVRWVVA